MRLGKKSKDLLELLCALGAGALEAPFVLPSLYRTVGFASEKSFREQSKRLRDDGWIVWDDTVEEGKWVVRLTAVGRAAVMGSVDPQVAWECEWDGKWRLLSFDLPVVEHRKRRQLNEWLKDLRFGRLQGSVWITPRPIADWNGEMARLKIDPRDAVYIEGAFGGANCAEDYVRKAWDLDEVNERYGEYRAFLRGGSDEPISGFEQWRSREQALWSEAFRHDPLLPKALWPEGFAASYLGPICMRERHEAYQKWGREVLRDGAQPARPG